LTSSGSGSQDQPMPLSAAVEMPQPRRQTCTTSATAAFGSKMTSVSTSDPLSTCLEVSTCATRRREVQLISRRRQAHRRAHVGDYAQQQATRRAHRGRQERRFGGLAERGALLEQSNCEKDAVARLAQIRGGADGKGAQLVLHLLAMTYVATDEVKLLGVSPASRLAPDAVAVGGDVAVLRQQHV